MASRTMKRHLRLAMGLYVVAFCAVMYVWQTSWSQKVVDSRSLSFLQDVGAYRPPGAAALHPPVSSLRHHHLDLEKAPPPSLRGRQDDSKQAPAESRQAQNNKNNKLIIIAETLDDHDDGAGDGGGGGGGGGGPGNGFREAVGVREGEWGKDHTLGSRLTQAFRSVLDCPQKLPLSFLGMNWTTVNLTQDPACAWLKASVRNPEANFVALGEEMAVLRDVTLDPSKFLGTRGGEQIERVFHQREDMEYFKVQQGFFSLPCKAVPAGVQFHVSHRNYRRFNHLNQWFSSLVCSSSDVNGTAAAAHNGVGDGGGGGGGGKPRSSSFLDLSQGYITGVTLALERYEYANVYHTMLDWYNVFLSVLLLGLDPNFVTFVIVDGHPWGKLDATWANMFGGRGVFRAGHLPRPTTFQHMVWVPNGYHCPLFDTDRQQVPFLPQLREYFFRSYGVEPNPGPRCQRLRVLLVRRRDYLAHPRNPSGVLARKMDNEDEVRDALRAAFPQHQVTAEQLDLLTMQRQLEILSRVDVLVGMHGAALTYTVLLPEGAALVELYPKYAERTSMLFKQISKWRGVHYVQWMNRDPKNEKPNKFTYIPTSVAVDLVKQVVAKMCTGG